MNIEKLRNLVTKFPHVTEDIKWGSDLCFCIGSKMFCISSLSSVDFGASIKVNPEEYALLIERDGISPAPYLARYKWIYISRAEVLTLAEWSRLLKESYDLVKSKLPRKLLNSFDKELD